MPAARLPDCPDMMLMSVPIKTCLGSWAMSPLFSGVLSAHDSEATQSQQAPIVARLTLLLLPARVQACTALCLHVAGIVAWRHFF